MKILAYDKNVKLKDPIANRTLHEKSKLVYTVKGILYHLPEYPIPGSYSSVGRFNKQKPVRQRHY